MKRSCWLLLIAGLLSSVGWSAVFIFPRAACVVVDRNHSGQYPLWFTIFASGDTPDGSPAFARFGYTSFQSTNTTIPQGNNNIFVQDPQFRDQPVTYQPGTHVNTFDAGFDPNIGLSWFLNGAFATADTSMPSCPAMSAGGVPLPAQFAPLGLASGQTVRLVVTTTSGASSCPATLSFADYLGSPIGPPSTDVSLQSGQSSSLDLVGSTVTTPGHRILVQPRFTTDHPDSCQASVEVFASNTGVTAATVRPIEPVYQYDFDPQGLSAGQTLRVNIAAAAGQSCGAALSFVNSAGNIVGPTLQQTLAAGTATNLDLPSTTAGLGLSGWSGGHVDIRPVLTTVATNAGYKTHTWQCPSGTCSDTTGPYIGVLQNGVLVSETCFASAEVFDTLTGYTRSVVNPQPLH